MKCLNRLRESLEREDSAKTWCRATIGVTAVIFILTFFIEWNLYLNRYLDAPPVLETYRRQNRSLAMPSVTVCTTLRARASVLRQKHNAIYDMLTRADSVESLRTLNQALDKLSKSEWKELAPEMSTLFTVCQYQSLNCTDYISEFYDDNYKKCFTINAKWDSSRQELPPAVTLASTATETTTSLFFELNLQSSEFMNIQENLFAKVFIHSEKTLPTTEDTFIIAEPGHLYEFKIDKVTTKSLPYPFHTNCTNYEMFRHEKRVNASMTRESCLQECVHIENLLKCNCSQKSYVYIFDSGRICNETGRKCTVDKMNQTRTYCKWHCKFPCTAVKYKIKSMKRETWPQLQGMTASSLQTTTFGRTNFVAVRLSYWDLQQSVLTYRPRLESTDVFRQIGGFFILWVAILWYVLLECSFCTHGANAIESGVMKLKGAISRVKLPKRLVSPTPQELMDRDFARRSKVDAQIVERWTQETMTSSTGRGVFVIRRQHLDKVYGEDLTR